MKITLYKGTTDVKGQVLDVLDVEDAIEKYGRVIADKAKLPMIRFDYGYTFDNSRGTTKRIPESVSALVVDVDGYKGTYREAATIIETLDVHCVLKKSASFTDKACKLHLIFPLSAELSVSKANALRSALTKTVADSLGCAVDQSVNNEHQRLFLGRDSKAESEYSVINNIYESSLFVSKYVDQDTTLLNSLGQPVVSNINKDSFDDIILEFNASNYRKFDGNIADKCRVLLSDIDGSERSIWIEVLLILARANDLDLAWEVFDEWSKKWEGYDSENNLATWEKYSNDVNHTNSITAPIYESLYSRFNTKLKRETLGYLADKDIISDTSNINIPSMIDIDYDTLSNGSKIQYHIARATYEANAIEKYKIKKAEKPKLEVLHQSVKFDNPDALVNFVNDSNDALLESAADDIPVLIPPMIAAGQVIRLYANQNTGKTLFALKLCLDGIKENKELYNRVIYVDLDQSQADYASRLKLLKNSGIVFMNSATLSSATDAMLTTLETTGANGAFSGYLIVIDTATAFADARKTEDNRLFSLRVRALSINTGAAILVLSHKNKLDVNGKSTFQGSVDSIDNCDQAYEMDKCPKRSDNARSVVVFKMLKRRSVGFTNATMTYSNLGDYADKLESLTFDLDEADFEDVDPFNEDEPFDEVPLLEFIKRLAKDDDDLTGGKIVEHPDFKYFGIGKLKARRLIQAYNDKTYVSPENDGFKIESVNKTRKRFVYLGELAMMFES